VRSVRGLEDYATKGSQPLTFPGTPAAGGAAGGGAAGGGAEEGAGRDDGSAVDFDTVEEGFESVK